MNIFIRLINLIQKIIRLSQIELIGLQKRPVYNAERNRFSYQQEFYPIEIRPDEKVLDVGCGAYPFPHATTLIDLYFEKTSHRNEALKTDGKPLIIADINKLPFTDKSFDYIYCSHVLEHVDNPIQACSEIVRVGKRGYIETPSIMTDVLFSWAMGMHKWFTVVVRNRLVFFEYDPRLVKGVRDDYWKKAIFSKRHHPLQDLFYKNQDIFNNGLVWENNFDYTVFRQDGKIESSDTVRPEHK